MSTKTTMFGLPFDNLTMSEVLAKIDGFIRDGRPHKIFTPNVALLISSRQDEFLRRVYETCDLLTVDGMAIYYASRLLGTPIRESLSASLMFLEILKAAQHKGYRFYLVGAEEPVVRAAAENIEREYAGVTIVGWHHGYFDVNNAESVVADIRRTRPDILLVGMSSPLKERFVERNLARMEVPVCLGVGGMFDIAAGRCRFAPTWVRKMCLEWLYRLLQEPRRLWKRYLTTNSAFLWLVLKEIVKQRLVA
jgi:N-acetylglucosaminyldiphosphoundecaprenol N-acetyl-beta-D-mannosaminyltransferase